MAKASTKQTSKKPEPKAAPNKGREIAKTEAAKVPSNVDVSALMEQDAGAGVSTDIADNIVPLVYILQSLSPQVLKQKPEYIKDAEAGNIWPRGEKTVWDGEEEGVEVVPVFFSKCWIEWRPNREGFAGRHAERPAEAVQTPDPKDPKIMKWVLPNGNTVQESREHVVLVIGKYDDPVPFVVPFSGSNHGASRSWMGLMNRKKTPKGNKAASFAYKYVLKTVPKSNDKGDWFGYAVEDTGEMVEPEEYLLARDIHNDFAGGKLVAGDHEAGHDTVSEDTSAQDDENI